MTIPIINLSPFIDRLSTTGFKSIREADGYFMQCANAVYGTYEFFSDLPNSHVSKTLANDTLAFIEKFEPELSRMLDALSETDFDCKNFHRLHLLLLTMEEDLPTLKMHLQKINSRE